MKLDAEFVISDYLLGDTVGRPWTAKVKMMADGAARLILPGTGRGPSEAWWRPPQPRIWSLPTKPNPELPK